MAVISISIIESKEQLVAGFPKTISLSSNISATIFYTTDGSEPSDMSFVYTAPITVPLDTLEFTLKAFATNGTDSSAVITHTYDTNIINNTRLPHATLANGDCTNSQGLSRYPFGNNTPLLEFDYLNNSNAGTTVSTPAAAIYPYGYDNAGNQLSNNKPIDDYLNIYSTADRNGRSGHGVGTLPGTVTVIGRRSPLSYEGEESSRASALFNPKAMVIFQDSTTEDPTNPPQINPQMFSLENLEITNGGAKLMASGLNGPNITGSFLRSHYNPRTQMITNYYRDSSTNKWIISSYPYEPKQTDPGNLSHMVFSRNDQGAGRVYSWNLFRYRTLT